MSRRKSERQSQGPADEAVEQSSQPSPSEPSPGFYERIQRTYAEDAAARAQSDKQLLLLQLAAGIRIHVKDGESAGSVALRVVDIADKVWQYGVERGFIQE